MVALAFACAFVPADAQEVRRGASPLDLPRPGYERRPIPLGPAELRLDLDVSGVYDSNVYATSENEIDDFALVAYPRAQIDYRSGSAEIHSELYANTRQYLDQERESATGFGGLLSAQVQPGQGDTLSGEFRFDRAIESRADPEARAGSLLLPPRKINVLAGELGYAHTGSSIGLNLTGGVDQYDYLDATEQDRDFITLRTSARATWQPAAPIAFFAEGYFNHRDFRLPEDFSGVDRDASTYGVLLGVSREVSARLRGRVGAGVFRFEPEDATLEGYTGFAMSGDVTWNPQPRTAVTMQLFRGDVATARAGATGRTDTRVSLTVDQEAYHNILLHGRAGWTRNEYRGTGSDILNTWSLAAEAEYLIDRHFSLFVGADYAQRSANDPLEEFSRARAQIGLRTRF